MKLNPLRVIATFLFFLTVATQSTSTAQTVPDPCVETAQYKDFLALAAFKKRLDDLQKKPNKTEFEEQTIQTLETTIRKTGIDTVIAGQIAEKNEVLAKDKVLLQCIQSKISQLTS